MRSAMLHGPLPHPLEETVIILEKQRRASGRAYASIVTVRWGETSYVLLLQHHPVGNPPWQASLHTGDVRDGPLWQSDRTEAATQAIDALLERIAPLGLPYDLLPLINDLLPTAPIGVPAYSPN